MRLVIKNEADSPSELSLSGETILVGHEPTRCQLCLPQHRWPMVARQHAELRVVNGVCYLFNLNSNAGTYVDGKQITQSVPVRVGSRMQFGQDGPVVTVVHVELVDSMPPPAAADQAAQPRPNHVQPEANRIVLSPAAKNKRAPVKAAYLEVTGTEPVNVKRLELTKDVVRVGRAPELDLVFDVAASFISRTHAEIRRTPEGYVLNDLRSFNGTLLNRQRIMGPSLLRDGDTIQLGLRGPILVFHQTGLRLSPPEPLPVAAAQPAAAAPTTAYVQPSSAGPPPPADISKREPVYVLSLGDKPSYSIGRAPDNDVRLDGLQISKQHARLTVRGTQLFIEDNRSTNGVYLNGLRLLGQMPVGPQDVIQIGPFVLRADLRRGLEVFDTRAQMRVDSISLTKVVPNNVGPGTLKLLDNVSLTIQPNEFVGLLGPSGAGKSTFIDALNGMRPATAGQVLINSLDLYQNLDWLKQSIGYVPQEDIMHRELTVYRTLYYVARLRLSQDVSDADIDLIVTEVLDVTGLTERRNVAVAQLSGGQRKRVSVAVELLTKPSIIFLDEPTSGLDPATEEKIMVLFRQIADSGHTIVLTTHAMENVRLFDKLVILMQGKLIFYGTPVEALNHVKARSFKELYSKLEEPITRQLATLPAPSAAATAEQQQTHKQRVAQIRESVAETWQRQFQQTAQYEQNVRQPQSDLPQLKAAPPPPKPRATLKHGWAQWRILCQRYAEVLRRDRHNLLILFGQAPIIACLTWLAVAADSTRDFPYFIMALVPVWFGTSVAAREMIRERAIYKRERMVNLGLWAYVSSKLGVLTVIVSLQCLILFGTLKLFVLFDLLKLPARFGGLPQLAVMILTGMVGVALGLLVSAAVKTSEMATSIVPLLLIPQILFCGLVGVPKGLTKTAGLLMPTTWSFDEMKRLSAQEVEVLRGKDEGAAAAYNNEGRGLYKQIRYENERAIENQAPGLEDYKADQEDKTRQLRQGAEDNQHRPATNSRARRRLNETEPPPPPKQPVVRNLPDDLSDYVDFLHPWGGAWLNPFILLVMFFSLATATVGVMRMQDGN
jgi:ABC-type multidrug transport system ATPase subunit